MRWFFFWIFFPAGFAFILFVMIYSMMVSIPKEREACASIDAEYHWGRDFGVCVKKDGSIWRVP